MGIKAMNWLGFFNALAGGLGIMFIVALFASIVFSVEGEEHRPWIVVGILGVLLLISLAMVGGLS